MSIKNSDLKILRSLPYPSSTDKVEACIKKFVDILYDPMNDMMRIIKAVKK